MNDKPDNQDLTGGELSNIPNDKYRKFFAKFSEIDTLAVEDYRPVHVLAYICKKFKETFGKEYTFKFNTPSPSKCFEVWQVKSLSSKLSSRPTILQAYIDWAMNEKAKTAKRKPTSISFLTQDDLVNRYKWDVLQPGSLSNVTWNRTTELPVEYRQACEESGWLTVKTFGDLAFLYSAIPSNEEARKCMDTCFAKLKSLGFQEELLKRIV